MILQTQLKTLIVPQRLIEYCSAYMHKLCCLTDLEFLMKELGLETTATIIHLNVLYHLETTKKIFKFPSMGINICDLYAEDNTLKANDPNGYLALVKRVEQLSNAQTDFKDLLGLEGDATLVFKPIRLDTGMMALVPTELNGESDRDLIQSYLQCAVGSGLTTIEVLQLPVYKDYITVCKS